MSGRGAKGFKSAQPPQGVSSMRELWSWMGTALALTGILRGILPAEYRDLFGDWLRKWITVISRHAFFVVREFEGSAMNELYVTVQTYLSSRTAAVALVSNLFQPRNAKQITFSLASDQRVFDTFNGAAIEWTHIVREKRAQQGYVSGNDTNSDEKRWFQLKVKRGDKDRILAGYLKHIADRAKEIERQKRELMLYTNKGKRGKAWEPVPFLHPATFDSLALDPALKSKLLDDLDDFMKGEEFYRRVGKSWKRGYLLFGPPGTGKSSMIAAIANKLRFDVYDLELTEVESNAELRRMLLQTSNKSIIVIEDIDCSLDLSGQRKAGRVKGATEGASESLQQQQLLQEKQAREETSKVTLSGLLNFTDGLWSSSGSERIFIFTTNFVEKLDPALLRPGRMDLHISLGYCTFVPFKILAKNYLEIDDHRLYPDVEREMEGCKMSPAEVAEVLTAQRRKPDQALENLIQALRSRKIEGPSKVDTEIVQTNELDDWKSLSMKQDRSIHFSNGVRSPPPSSNGVRKRLEAGGGREGGFGGNFREGGFGGSFREGGFGGGFREVGFGGGLRENGFGREGGGRRGRGHNQSED